MAVKKTHPSKQTKREPISEPPIDRIPDIFDEDGARSVVPSLSPRRGPMMVEIEDVTVDVIEPQAENSVPESIPQENDLPTPTEPVMPEFSEAPIEPERVIRDDRETIPSEESLSPTYTVRSNGRDVEPALPSFFTEASTPPMSQTVSSQPQEESNIAPVQDTSMLEAMVPQAFVGEVREVATEAKQEKKSAFVTFFIIAGMILVAGGVIGFYVLSTRKSAPASAPSPLVDATPMPTPLVVVQTATNSAQTAPADTTTPTTKLKVNVQNGTATKGLAAKEAAVLKKAGYTIGTVGNGDPALKGTIIVPTGQSDAATGIQSALSDFTFKVKEDAKATAITVVLGE